jgi:sugar lactone lactonase YvrE
MFRSNRLVCVVVGAMLLAAAPIGLAADWTNYGGNANRNGLTTEFGPLAADLLWSNTDDFSIISWHPFILDRRVFAIRESGFPQDGGSANDALVAYDLDSGGELWRHTLSFGGDTSQEWIAWIGGVNNGHVYASRSSHGQPQPIKAFDVVDGGLIWISEWHTQAWAHDGVVFAPNGDLIVGDFENVVRIDATDGSTVWVTPRSCPVSGNCGGAATATMSAVYIDEAAPGGNVITKLDMATGAVLYSSPVMAGITNQNGPFVSPDETTVYFSRTQNNVAVDFLYAFEDDGTQFIELWHRPVRWTTSHEHGIGPDGSIYTFTQDDEFVRLDPVTGDILSNAGVLSPLGSPNLSPKTAVDASGNVYVSNGWASTPATNGRLWAFNADLSETLFVLNLDRQNAGGPALGADGTLVVADRQRVYGYRSELCPGDVDGDADTDLSDLAALLGAYGSSLGDPDYNPDADFDGDGDVDLLDLAFLLGDYGCGT